jgi:AhpD family alkylhydroperoxidase
MEQALPRTLSYPEQLSQIKRGLRRLAASQPETMQAFTALHRATTGPGALDPKTKELIALAVGVAAHCDGCIAFHTHDALKAGATEAEIMETLGVAVLMGVAPRSCMPRTSWRPCNNSRRQKQGNPHECLERQTCHGDDEPAATHPVAGLDVEQHCLAPLTPGDGQMHMAPYQRGSSMFGW